MSYTLRYVPTIGKNIFKINKRPLLNASSCLYKTTAHRWKDKGNKDVKDPEEEKKDLAGSVSSRFEVFSDENAPIVFDLEEEREKFYEISDMYGKGERQVMDLSGITPERGTTGVIDLDELIQILKKEKVLDIFVVKLPESLSYADFMVIATCKSTRQMNAVVQFVRKVYKFKCKSEIPSTEGKSSTKWKALDLKNIALHIMSESARKYYDLESLWSVGKDYDPLSMTKVNEDEDEFLKILSSLESTETS